jgi:hypothetical protein
MDVGCCCPSMACCDCLIKVRNDVPGGKELRPLMLVSQQTSHLCRWKKGRSKRSSPARNGSAVYLQLSRDGDLKLADRAYLSKVVAARTGLSQQMPTNA